MKKRPEQTVSEDIIKTGLSCLELLDQKKAGSPVLMDLRRVNSYLDFFIIATGNSQNHCRALSRDIEKKLHDDGFSQKGRPDYDSEWIILDFGELIIHIFTDETRHYYQLEKLWADSTKYFINEGDQ